MALGSSRADGVRDQLVKLGIASDRIKTISYGKEKPFCDRTEREVLAAESPRTLLPRSIVQRATARAVLFPGPPP